MLKLGCAGVCWVSFRQSPSAWLLGCADFPHLFLKRFVKLLPNFRAGRKRQIVLRFFTLLLRDDHWLTLNTRAGKLEMAIFDQLALAIIYYTIYLFE